jgi:putative membrane protein
MHPSNSTQSPAAGAGMIGGSSSNELASSRTTMAFERTELAGERTLMAIVRTSLSLIGFGFTIYKFLQSVLPHMTEGEEPRRGVPARIGLSLVLLGVVLLVFGLIGHWYRVRSLQQRRDVLQGMNLLHPMPRIPLSSSFFVAFALLVVGLLLILRMALGVGPF